MVLVGGAGRRARWPLLSGLLSDFRKRSFPTCLVKSPYSDPGATSGGQPSAVSSSEHFLAVPRGRGSGTLGAAARRRAEKQARCLGATLGENTRQHGGVCVCRKQFSPCPTEGPARVSKCKGPAGSPAQSGSTSWKAGTGPGQGAHSALTRVRQV